MGKNGIITFHRASSYGAVMQTLALQQSIKNLGNEVEIINYHSPYMSVQKQIFSDFCERYLSLSQPYYTSETICAESYETVITGSDQVWNTELINDSAFFLSFVKGQCKKVAYSASVGVNKEVEIKLDREKFAKYICNFDAISVREGIHVPYVQQFANCDVKVTIDPVLLLKSNDYDEMFKNEIAKVDSTQVREKDYIFYHGVGISAKMVDFLNLLSMYTGYRIIAVSDYDKFLFKKDAFVLQNIRPEEWIYYIKNAKIVITNSYHSMLFSIIYNVPFYVYTAKEHTNVTRLLEVIDTLGLQDRKIMNIKNISEAEFEMDYGVVNDKIKEKREDAYRYLRSIVK